jgi:phenylacetate-CoA ligase
VIIATRPDASLLQLRFSGAPKPTAIFFSSGDIENSAQLIARSLVATGVTRNDVLQNMMSYGLFTGGLIMHYGAEKLGCLVIPAGPGTSERQLMLMQDFRTTAIHILPSYALYFAGFLEQRGLKPGQDLALRKAFVGAEPIDPGTLERFAAAFAPTATVLSLTKWLFLTTMSCG